MYRVDYDSRANRMRLHVNGFWTIEDVTAFATAIGVKGQEIRASHPDYDVLVESFDFPVQANDVAELLRSVMLGGITLTSGRAAVVVGSLLNKLQAERTLQHPRVQVFATMDKAEAWLDAPTA